MPLSSVLGTLARVWFNVTDLSDYLNSLSESGALNANDVTTFGHSVVVEDPGLGQDGFSFDGFLSVGVGEVEPILRVAFAARSRVPLTVSYSGDVLGARAMLCQVWHAALNITSAAGDATALDGEFTTKTGLFAGFLLHALTAVAGAGTTFTAATDFGAAALAYAATLHVVAASGTGSPSLTVTVQSSATAGGTYVDAFSFAVVSGTTPTSEYKAGTVALDRWRRLKIVVAGTSPAYTFGVGQADRPA